MSNEISLAQLKLELSSAALPRFVACTAAGDALEVRP